MSDDPNVDTNPQILVAVDNHGNVTLLRDGDGNLIRPPPSENSATSVDDDPSVDDPSVDDSSVDDSSVDDDDPSVPDPSPSVPADSSMPVISVSELEPRISACETAIGRPFNDKILAALALVTYETRVDA